MLSLMPASTRSRHKRNAHLNKAAFQTGVWRRFQMWPARWRLCNRLQRVRRDFGSSRVKAYLLGRRKEAEDGFHGGKALAPRILLKAAGPVHLLEEGLAEPFVGNCGVELLDALSQEGVLQRNVDLSDWRDGVLDRSVHAL